MPKQLGHVNHTCTTLGGYAVDQKCVGWLVHGFKPPRGHTQFVLYLNAPVLVGHCHVFCYTYDQHPTQRCSRCPVNISAVGKVPRACGRTLYFFTAGMIYTLWGLMAASVIIVSFITALSGLGLVDELVDETAEI